MLNSEKIVKNLSEVEMAIGENTIDGNKQYKKALTDEEIAEMA